jgi:hypothetical protein
VLEIATGPFPEINALDMLVFATLAKGALERHWIPTRFGEEGVPLVEAFDCLVHESWETAAKFLDRRQQVDLRELITRSAESAGAHRRAGNSFGLPGPAE